MPRRQPRLCDSENLFIATSRGKLLVVDDYGMDHVDLPPLDAGRIDPRLWFDLPQNKLELEIGCGKGTFLVQQARIQPKTNFLAFEWAGEFFRYAADRMRRHQLRNVKIIHTDATQFIQHRCASEVAAVIHLYFSDPWPKTRHHKRRVVQDLTLVEFHRVLQADGELRLVTDHSELWEWYELHATRNASLFERRMFDRPLSAGEGEVVGSNFERKYREEGRPFFAMTLVKK